MTLLLPSAPTGPAGLPTALVGIQRCLVMAVLNVTPDSFSDGGRWLDEDAAVAHGLALLADGADLVDVGGESTRPGALRVPAEEEQRRVLPVIRRLSDAGAVVCVDTMRAATARAALDAGAALVNDVSGGLADADMAGVLASSDVPYVVMHWRGPSERMEQLARYEDVVADVRAELAARVDALVADGIARERLVLDPGIGFAKDAGHNWAALAGLGTLRELGRPLLVGASRKRFLGSLLAGEAGGAEPVPVERREDATTAVTALVAAAGAWCVRVHSARASADAVRVVAALQAAAR